MNMVKAAKIVLVATVAAHTVLLFARLEEYVHAMDFEALGLACGAFVMHLMMTTLVLSMRTKREWTLQDSFALQEVTRRMAAMPRR